MRPLYTAQPTSNHLQNLSSTNMSVCCTDIRNCYKNQFSENSESTKHDTSALLQFAKNRRMFVTNQRNNQRSRSS